MLYVGLPVQHFYIGYSRLRSFTVHKGNSLFPSYVKSIITYPFGGEEEDTLAALLKVNMLMITCDLSPPELMCG